jgi:uncharacterized protein (DUF885 family)
MHLKRTPHRLLSLLWLAFTVAVAGCELPKAEVGTQEEVAKASAQLHKLLHDYDSTWMAQDGLYALRNGSRPTAASAIAQDDAHLQVEIGILTAWRERLAREIDTTHLDEVAEQDRRLFMAYADQRFAAYKMRRFPFPVDALPSPGTDAFFRRLLPLETAADAQAYLSRLQELPALLRQWQADLRQREADSLLPPAFVLRQVRRAAIHSAGIATLDSHLVADPAHPWLQRLSAFAETQPELAGQRDAMSRKAWETYAYQAIPEYNQLLEWFLQQEAEADTFKVLSQFKGGNEWYGYQLSQYAGAPTTPDDAYTLGMTVTDKLSMEMEELLRKERFPGGIKIYMDSLRRSREWHLFPAGPQGRQDFTQAVRRMQDSLERKTPEVVEGLPPFSMRLRFAESLTFDGGSPWSVSKGPGDTLSLVLDLGARDRLESWRWRAELVRTALPGSELMKCFDRRIHDSIPPFRRELGATWLSEGWGLYSLRLPIELGWYTDSAYRKSVIIEELMSAALLVTDAGLHANGWKQTDAERYLREHTPMGESEIDEAIRNMLAKPGATVAAVAGCERIKAWRDQASKALGQKFRLPAFHQQLLQKGALPVTLLQAEMDALLRQSSPAPNQP